MAEEKKDRTIIRHSVPTKDVIELRETIFEFLYKKNDDDGKVYRFIKDNPDLTISAMRKQLERKMGIYRRKEGIQKIADWCGLDYKNNKKTPITPPGDQSTPQNPAL